MYSKLFRFFKNIKFYLNKKKRFKNLPSSVNDEEFISNKLRISLNGISITCL